MSVTARGVARIRHRDTGVVYEIQPDDLEWDETVGEDERGMGPEFFHFAQVDHPELGPLTWELWEYPIGAPGEPSVDVGDHALLDNFQLSLNESSDPDDDYDPGRVDELVAWFHEHYEDPAERTPHESREGGYQWIWGGPYDAREELENEFPDEDPAVIKAAVEEVESNGLVEWAPAPSPSDYDDDYPDEDDAFADDAGADAFAAAIREAVRNIPTVQDGPIFALDATGRIEFAGWPAGGDTRSPQEQPLLQELRDAVEGLVQALNGTNAHQDLLASVRRYQSAIAESAPAIAAIYSRGVTLESAADLARAELARDERSPLPLAAEQHLRSALELHAALVMADPEGRRLAEGAAAYRQAPNETAALRDAVRELAGAVQRKSELFGSAVSSEVSEAAAGIGAAPQPARSTQVGMLILKGLLASVGKIIKDATPAIIFGLVTNAINASAPGAAVVNGAGAAVTLAWNFILAQAPHLQTLAAIVGADMQWLAQLSQVAMTIRRRRAKAKPAGVVA